MNRRSGPAVKPREMRISRWLTLAALAFVVGCRESGPVVISSPSATASPEARENCQFPRYRPSYLPWVDPGRDVPVPGRDRLPGGGPQGLDPAYAILIWGFGDISEPGAPKLEGTLSLWRSTESVGAIPADREVPLLPDGASGRFYRGSDGPWSIVWVDPFPSPYEDPCSETTLSLTMPQLSPEQQRRELVRVADSLDAA
jgi:hypothetical protein